MKKIEVSEFKMEYYYILLFLFLVSCNSIDPNKQAFVERLITNSENFQKIIDTSQYNCGEYFMDDYEISSEMKFRSPHHYLERFRQYGFYLDRYWEGLAIRHREIKNKDERDRRIYEQYTDTVQTFAYQADIPNNDNSLYIHFSVQFYKVSGKWCLCGIFFTDYFNPPKLM